MNFIDKMVERFIKLNRRMKRWQRVVSVMAAVVVFATTYALILPAITLDRDTATAEPGIEVAASENEAGEAGTVFENTEEPAPEETAEEPEEAVAEDSGSESGSQEVEAARAEAVAEENTSEGNTSEVAPADDSEQTEVLTTEEAATYGTTEEAIAAVTGQTAEEVKLITEDTQLTFDGSDYVVYADFGESAKLPEGVQLQVKEITKDSDPEAYEMYYQKALSEMQGKYDENTTLSFAKFYDIAFVYEGVEIEPSGNVNVRIDYKKAQEIQSDANVETIHFDKRNDEKPEIISSDADVENDEINAVEFESDQFSVYGIVGTETIIVPFVASDGSTYEVTVNFDKEAGIPQNAKLEVTEVGEDSSRYEEYVAQAAEAIDAKTIDLQYVKLLDISIVDENGNKVTLDKPVDVQIKLLDKNQAEETTKVIHFEGTDEIPVLMESNVEGDKVAFSTDGFSVYAVVDPGQGGDEARIALNFHKGDGTTVTMYVKNKDVLLGDGTRTDGQSYIEDIVYDPGAYIPTGYLFLGWTEEENYTKDSERKTIEDIRTEVAALADSDSIKEGDSRDYYAAIYKVVNVAYLGDGGVSLGTDSFLRTPNDPASFSYTVNMAYTADSTHNFEGWLVKEGGSNIANHSEGKVYKNETDITISGSVTFSVDAPEGQWLVFHENKGTYIPPQFVKSGEVTKEPTAEMKRLGYTFDGWYTKDGTDDDWGSRFTFGETITDRTHVYAKWSTVPTANYVVLIWKQNVNDAKNAADNAKTYDFAESITLSGNVNTIINTVTAQGTGNNRYARVDGTNKQYAGFHLNRFDTNVTIAPEGSTVLNVYYDRNLVTLTFQYRNNGRWATQATMTGLYGSTLTSNGYTWPTNRWWYDSYQQWGGDYYGAGTRTTFLDAFKLANDASEHTYYGFTGNGNRTVYFYKKNADNDNYTLTNQVSITGGNNATFYISDKYNGYKAVSYSRNNYNWTSLGNKDSDGYYASISVGNQDLYIRYDPLLYNILYMDGVYVDGDGNPVSGYESQGRLNHVNDIPFESSVASYNKGGTNYYEPTAKYDGFVFDGWYIDDACTQAYTFTNMPEGITVYAKWVQTQYRVFLHPEAGTDTSLDWGSDDQAMNFRVSYLGKVNTPFGTRNEYEFVGWFTESGAPFNDETLLTDTNTVPYNKATDMTDPMDKWGNLGANPYNSDAIGYDGGDRFWITRKLDLYGKWRRVIDGAEGIGIVYDLNGGTGSVSDTTLYKDSASAVAQNAPTAPAAKQFDHWVVQTWNNTTKQYEDTSVVVYPGDNFDVLKNDSKVEVTEWKSSKESTATTQAQSPAAVYSGADEITGPTGYPYISKATYTIQLKAVYIDAGEHTPTHIDWYENYDDNTKVHSDPHLHINEAVEIVPALERTGYTFLGWARVPTTESGSDQGDATVLDLDESDVYLKYHDVSGRDPYWTVNVNETERTVTHVAADEIIPYHDMYAVWKAKTYTVTVVKVVDGIDGDAAKEFTFKPDISGVPGEDFILTGTSGSNTKVVSEEVPYGSKLKITESALEDFTASATYTVTNADAETDNVTDQPYTNGAELDVKGDTVITFTNTRSQQHLHIKKVGNDAADGLGGAEFSLGTFTTLVSDSETGTLGDVYYMEDNEKIYDIVLPVSETAYTLSETTAPEYYSGIVDDVPVTVSKGSVSIGTVSGASISGPVDGVYTITITNTRKTATVTLTKNVDGLEADIDTEFEFTITGIGSDRVIKNLVGNTESENHTVTYNEVPYGASITITETQNSDFDCNYSVNGGESTAGNIATFTVGDDTVTDGIVAVTFMNARNNQTLQVLKVDEGTKPLANAVFALYTEEEYNKGESGTPVQADLTSDEQGSIQIGAVGTGKFYLVETTAPGGYNLLDKPVIITIDSNRVYATLGSDSSAQNLAQLITPETGKAYWQITVHNNSGVELPNSGGSGTLLYTLSGLMLILASAMMYGFRMRRGERRIR